MNDWSTPQHALDYLAQQDQIRHRTEGEAVVLEQIPAGARRILDLGCGDGRLLALVLIGRPEARGVAVDFSKTMLDAVRKRFQGDPRVEVIEHNLDRRLPALGRFDAAVSCFAIHHLEHPRKRELYEESYALLDPGGVFLNLEHVEPATPGLHARFLDIVGRPEDPSNKLLDIETQLRWLREIGFAEVDCHWKWMEIALLGGTRPR